MAVSKKVMLVLLTAFVLSQFRRRKKYSTKQQIKKRSVSNGGLMPVLECLFTGALIL